MNNHTPSPQQTHKMNTNIPVGALDRPIAYHRVFRAIAGSTVAAVFLSQAWYWSQRLPDQRDGWFYKTQAEWEEETGLSITEQGTARKKLKAIGVLQDELRGVPAQLWYRIDPERLASLIRETLANKNRGTIESSIEESSKLESRNPRNIHTESTAETTAEIELVDAGESDGESVVAKPTKPLSPKKSSTVVPDDFQPSDKTIAWAVAKGVRASDIVLETEAFIAYHGAKGNRFVDHQKAFQTWINNGIKWERIKVAKVAPRSTPKPSAERTSAFAAQDDYWTGRQGQEA